MMIVVVSDNEKSLQPVQQVALSPAPIVDYLSVESRLEKPVRGEHHHYLVSNNKLQRVIKWRNYIKLRGVI